jgi:hypothetical protein
MQLEDEPTWMGEYYTYCPVPTPVARLPRAAVDRMLLRVFLKTVLPAKYSNARQPYHPREVLNMQAFFRFLLALARSG